MAKRKSKIKILPYTIYGIFSLLFLTILFISVLVFFPDGSFLILKEEIGDRWSFFYISIAILFICLINFIASWGLYKKDILVSHILGALAVFVPAVVLLKIISFILFY